MAKSKKKSGDSKKPAGPKLPKKKIRVRNQVKKGTHGGMMLVLVEDVNHLGKQGDLVEVKPGYGRNYLLPNSLAIIPTEHNLKRLDAYKIKVEKAREARKADLKVLAEQLTRLQLITIEANANEENHLYGSIGAPEISKFLKGKNLMVDAEMIRMEHPIKEANTMNEVVLNLGYGIETKIQVIVVALQQAVKK
jgi:large subunit ribosomal protein L9